MPASIEKIAEIQQRRLKVVDLWFEKPNLTWIAEQLKVSIATIKGDVDNLGLGKNREGDPIAVPDDSSLAMPYETIPSHIINRAVSFVEAWEAKGQKDPASANVYLKGIDLLARLVGAYAPEKRLNANMKIEPPKPITIPAEVIEGTGEILKELNIEQDDTREDRLS